MPQHGVVRQVDGLAILVLGLSWAGSFVAQEVDRLPVVDDLEQGLGGRVVSGQLKRHGRRAIDHLIAQVHVAARADGVPYVGRNGPLGLVRQRLDGRQHAEDDKDWVEDQKEGREEGHPPDRR